MKGYLLIILSCRVLSYAFPIFSNTEEEEIKLHENSSYLPKIWCAVNGTEEPYADDQEMFLNIGKFSLFPGGPKWPRTNLTYSIENIPRYFNPDEVFYALEIAFNVWSKHTPLLFFRVSKKGDISITFYGHDYKTPFTEPILAFAHAPGKGRGGDIYLNGNVTWTLDNYEIFSKKGTSLFITVVHEIGHALGIGHSIILGALMNREYTPSHYKYAVFLDYNSLQLHDDDIAAIQALYGPHPTSSQKPKQSSHTPIAGSAV